MNTPLKMTIAGQALLVICCVFYLIWWSISFRPDVTVNRVSGLNGFLLLITAVCGLFGVVLSVTGMNTLTKTSILKINGALIVVCGIAAYIFLLLLTRFALKRTVTTELFLITAWTVLEISLINAWNAGGAMSDRRFIIACGVIAAAFLISIVLYVLYYRMEPMKAFFAAMVPLITEAGTMIALILMVCVGS